MTDARTAIFAAIRAATVPADPGQIAAGAAALVADPDQVRSPVGDLVAGFIARATSAQVTATVSEIPALAALPGEIRVYLDYKNLPRRTALQPHPALLALDWEGIATGQDIAPDEALTVSLAEAAVAETGSVLMRSGADAPFLLNFLPLHHIIVVPKRRILRHIEDAFAFVGTAQADQPRVMSLITGTSGTADIEAQNIRGAHGPRFMHLILCDGV